MNLKHLSDNQLINATESLVSKERELLTDILHHLKEIERRRLFSSLGFKSLFDYATKKLSYSEDQAYRRISAMRLLKELPEMEEKINSGSLNLSHLSLAQGLFKKESHTQIEKIELLIKLENTPAREAQKIIFAVSSNPQSLTQERTRQITEDLSELKFPINEDVKKKLEIVKGLYAHSDSNISMNDLLDKLCDMAIATKTATFRKRCVTKNKGKECEICHSTYALEIDHVIPKAKGGTDDPQNLRTLCRNCNQRAAVKEFGLQKMSSFINGSH